MKIKLVSASFGGDSELIINNNDELQKYNVKVVLYNDSNTSSRALSLHPRLKAKIPKMLEWELNEDYDYYIWVDSKFTLNDGIINELLKGIEGYDLCLFKHPYRNNIKEELDFMNSFMSMGNGYLIDRYSGEEMNKQVETYLNDNDFIDNKFFACGCFIYTKELVKNKNYNLLKEWFYHNTLYSVQDQLSLPYLLTKFKTNYNIYDFNLLNCRYLQHI